MSDIPAKVTELGAWLAWLQMNGTGQSKPNIGLTVSIISEVVFLGYFLDKLVINPRLVCCRRCAVTVDVAVFEPIEFSPRIWVGIEVAAELQFLLATERANLLTIFNALAKVVLLGGVKAILLELRPRFHPIVGECLYASNNNSLSLCLLTWLIRS